MNLIRIIGVGGVAGFIVSIIWIMIFTRSPEEIVIFALIDALIGATFGGLGSKKIITLGDL